MATSPWNGPVRPSAMQTTKPASGLFPKRKPVVTSGGVPGMTATRNNLKADRLASMPKKGK